MNLTICRERAKAIGQPTLTFHWAPDTWKCESSWILSNMWLNINAKKKKNHLHTVYESMNTHRTQARRRKKKTPPTYTRLPHTHPSIYIYVKLHRITVIISTVSTDILILAQIKQCLIHYVSWNRKHKWRASRLGFLRSCSFTVFLLESPGEFLRG